MKRQREGKGSKVGEREIGRKEEKKRR